MSLIVQGLEELVQGLLHAGRERLVRVARESPSRISADLAVEDRVIEHTRFGEFLAHQRRGFAFAAIGDFPVQMFDLAGAVCHEATYARQQFSVKTMFYCKMLPSG